MSLLMENSVAKIGCGDPGELIEFAALLNASSANPGYLRCAPGEDVPSYKFAFSGWVKNVTAGSIVGPLLTAGISASATQWLMSSEIGRGDGSTVNTASIAAEHKDAAAWGHLLIKADTTAGTLAVNRAEFTIGGYTYPLDANLLADGGSLYLLDPQRWQAIGANINSAGGLISSNRSFKLASVDIITGDATDDLSAQDFGYFNSDGVLVPKRYQGQYGLYGRRFDFADPADMGKDTSSENLVAGSEDFSSGWNANGINLAGTNRLVPNTANDYHYIADGVPVVAGQSYVAKSWVSPEEFTEFNISFGSTRFGSQAYAVFDLSGDGSVIGAGTQTSNVSCTLQPDGRYLCQAEALAIATSETAQIGFMPNPVGNISRFPQYAGTGTDGLTLHKVHVRNATSPDRYEKTTNAVKNLNHFEVVGNVRQVTDTPTNNKINYDPHVAGDAGGFFDGNTTVNGNNSAHAAVSHPIRKGVIQVEFEIGYGNSNSGSLRVSNDPNFNSTAQTVHYRTDGQKYLSGAWSAYGAAWGSPTFPTDRMGVLIDAYNQTVEFFKNGASQGLISLPFAGPYFVGGTKAGLNEGAVKVVTQLDDMLHPVDGADTLEWENADCPAIPDPSRYVQAPVTISGGAVTSLWNCLTNKTLVISKRRDTVADFRLNVVIGGVQYIVAVNVDGAEVTDADGLSFTSNGFALGSDTQYQGTCEHFVRRASPLAGMDFVLIGNHVAGQVSTIAHNCGGAVQRAWDIPLNGGDIRQFHHKMPAGDYTRVNVAGRGNDPDWFSSTPNTVSIGGASVAGRHLLILERGVPQFSSFDVYDGNGVVDGPMIPADFAPLSLDVVRGDAVGPHTVRTLRNGEANPVFKELSYDSQNAENVHSDNFYMLSNGAKCAADASFSGGEYTNANGGKYYTGMHALYPGKFANAR